MNRNLGLTRIEPETLWSKGQHSNCCAKPARAIFFYCRIDYISTGLYKIYVQLSLAGVVSGLRVSQRVMGSIPSTGQGECGRQPFNHSICLSHINVSLSPPLLPDLVPSTLCKNQWKKYPWVRINKNKKYIYNLKNNGKVNTAVTPSYSKQQGCQHSSSPLPMPFSEY